MDREKVKIWQESVFQEIVASQNTHWILQMPRRHGKTHLMNRLIKYYIAEGKEIHIISNTDEAEDYLLGRLIHWYMMLQM